MSDIKEFTLKLSSGAGTTATADDTRAVLGKLYAVQWTQGDAAATVDITISAIGGRAAKTLLTLTDQSASALYYPRDLVHDATGTALTGLAGGDRCLPLIDGIIRAAAAQMGNNQNCYVTIFYLEE